MKLINKLLASTALLSVLSFSSCSIKPEPYPSCEADVTMHLITDYEPDSYGFDATITNIGDREIKTVIVPFTLYFNEGGSDSREAYTPDPLALQSGDSKKTFMYISPANQDPYNPRWIDLQGKTIDNVKYDEPEVQCSF